MNCSSSPCEGRALVLAAKDLALTFSKKLSKSSSPPALIKHEISGHLKTILCGFITRTKIIAHHTELFIYVISKNPLFKRSQ